MKNRLAVLWMTIILAITCIGCGQQMENTKIPAMNKTIFNEKISWNNHPNLYEISNQIPENAKGTKVYRVENDLLFTYEIYDETLQKTMFEIKRISINDGQVLYRQQLETLLFSQVQVLDNHVAVNDLADGKSYLFDYRTT